MKPTLPLLITNSLVYVGLSFAGGSFLSINSTLLYFFGQSNQLVFNGQYWQLFSSLFIHANILHLLGNGLFLLIFGLKIEELFSSTVYLIIYFSSGVVGNLLTLLMGPHIVSVGASGAIFGMFGAGTMYIRMGLKQSLMSALIYSFYLFILNIGANVNILAHFGGLVTGLGIGFVIGRHRERELLDNV